MMENKQSFQIEDRIGSAIIKGLLTFLFAFIILNVTTWAFTGQLFPTTPTTYTEVSTRTSILLSIIMAVVGFFSPLDRQAKKEGKP